MTTSIRLETAEDTGAIRDTIRAAFAAKSHLQHRESDVVDKLRASNNLTLSLVAERSDTIVGHIAISPVQIQDAENWFGLGPVAVHPNSRKQGIGSELVKTALERLKEQEACGCVVLGRPDFYTRFGFSQDHSLRFEGAPRKFFMALPMKGPLPECKVKYHEAFDA